MNVLIELCFTWQTLMNVLIVLFYMTNNRECFDCVVSSWQTIMNVLIVLFFMAHNNECFN